jgi:tRNA(fMet)-specific endonuclease VapC
MPISGAEPIRRLVLDTSAYSHFRAGHQTVLDLLAAADAVLLPATVLGELEAGFEMGRRALENRTTLARFLQEPFVTVLPTTPEVARRYGQTFARLRQAGTPIPTNDIWIAAATLDAGGRLLTFDAHFQQVTGLDSVLLP